MKENTRVRVNHDFILVTKNGCEDLKKPYGLVESVDSHVVKVKLDLYSSEALYFYENELQVIP